MYLKYYNLLIAQDLLASSLSNLVNIRSEEIHKIRCNYGHNDQKM